MYKNWKEICQIENAWLRMLVATTDEPNALGKIAKGFPELFSQEEIELKVPYTALKTKAYESRDELDASILMCNVLEPMGIPSICLGYDGDEGLPDRVPSEWLSVIREIHHPRRGYDILEADQLADPTPRIVHMLGEDYWIAELNEFKEEDGTIGTLLLVPAKLIDFDK